jgi:PAS domain S-box-containing protein
MADKLSYEELEQRVRQLDKEVAELKRCEEGLRASEEKWRSLFKSAPDQIITVDREGIITDINQAVAGLEVEKVVGTSHYDYALPEYHKVMKESVEEVFETGKGVSYEIAGAGPEGSTSWYVTRLGPVKRGGEVVGVTIIPSDITERKQAEVALRENEQKYRALVESSIDGICIVAGQEIVFANETALESFGCRSAVEMVGHSWTEFVSPEYLDVMTKRGLATVKGEDVPGRYEFKALRKDGTQFDAELSVSAISYNSRLATQSVVRDITERKLLENELSESEERYRQIFEGAAEGIVVADIKTRKFRYVNAAMCRMLGYTGDELVRMGVDDIHPKEVLEFVISEFEAQAKGAKVLAQGVPCLRKDGMTIYANINTTYMVIDGKECNVGFFTDITERKLAEEVVRERETSLEIQADELQEVNTALRVLLRQRDKDKTELEEKVFLNVRELVMPHVEKLKKSAIDARQKGYLRVLASNLNEIISPFAHRLSSKYSALTPTEIQMAFLIRDGKSTKEIAGLLNLSGRTVESHRQSIRMKMGIRNRRANLRSHLLSM